MSDPFIGEIRPVPYNFAPRGWAFCAGQVLPIAQNTALFSLLGTTYGGNGQSTFCLPDLRGRVPVMAGTAPDQTYDLGELAGVETLSLLVTQMPSHGHGTSVSTVVGDQISPENHLPASTQTWKPYSTTAPNTSLIATAVQNSGGGQPHDNMQPYLVINYIIALEGIYPSRS